MRSCESVSMMFSSQLFAVAIKYCSGLQTLPHYAAIIGSCHIQKSAHNAAAHGGYNGEPQTTYSCVADDNCNYDVHVLGMYKSTGRHILRHTNGYTDVYLTVTGNSTRPLILVVSSKEHVQWTLHIPPGVVIDRVIIVSYKYYKYPLNRRKVPILGGATNGCKKGTWHRGIFLGVILVPYGSS